MNRSDLQQLAEERVADARVLLEGGRWSAAYYVIGYAVECAFKACIAKETKEFDFPPRPSEVRDVYTHDLAKLMRLAGLEDKWAELEKRDARFAQNWSDVREWNEEARYGRQDESVARKLFRAVTDESNGVLTCIREHW